MIEVPLSSKKHPGHVALIDDEDYELVAGYSWCPLKRGHTFYGQAHVPGSGAKNQRRVYMHRLIRPDIAGEIDHKDRNGLNNTHANLRPATRVQQIANQGISRSNTSGYKGVSWHRQAGKWEAGIRIDGKLQHLGLFDDLAEAGRVYDGSARHLFGEFAVCNFPEETWNVGLPEPKILQARNTSGYRGVTWYKRGGKWQVQIAVNGKRKFLGRFDDPADAAMAYDAAARELHGDQARLNFPNEMMVA